MWFTVVPRLQVEGPSGEGDGQGRHRRRSGRETLWRWDSLESLVNGSDVGAEREGEPQTAPGFWGAGDLAGAAVIGTVSMLEKEGTEGK